MFLPFIAMELNSQINNNCDSFYRYVCIGIPHVAVLDKGARGEYYHCVGIDILFLI